MAIAKRYQDQHEEIKCNIENAYQYFRPNYDRYNEFIKFVFVTSLSEDDISLLKTLLKPQIEDNILCAYVARLRGEFAQQEPSVVINADEDYPADPNIETLLEAHFKQLLFEANLDGFEYRTYSDVLAGGFSVAKVYCDYKNNMEFKQIIKVVRAFDPTLCGFDPSANETTKRDGQFSFELYPKKCEEFEAEYPDIDISKIKFSKGVGPFNWSYRNDKTKIILMGDYYKKVKKSIKIVQLSNGKVVRKDQYKKFMERWQDSGIIAQPPQIIQERDSEEETIERYLLIENQIIKKEDTNYKYLPHVFIDGDSVLMRDASNGEIQQVTRPYVMHAKGAQKLRNFSMQSLANELENMVQHKIMIPLEGIPNGQENVYTQVQIPNTILYNQYKDDNPNIPLNKPELVVRTPIPPEVTNTITLSEQMTQSTLGSFSAQQGDTQNKDLSGTAFQEIITQSNSAAMPYIKGYLMGLTQIAQIILDLIPKIYVEERNISARTPKGDVIKVPINSKDGSGVQMTYEENAFHVNVEAGVNFSVQKSRAIQQLIALSQASPLFSQFMNQEGLEVLVDNLEIRGADQLKQMAQKFMQQVQQQAQQNSNQPNPQVMKVQLDAQKLQQDAQKMQGEFQLRQQQFQIDNQNMINDRMKILSDAQSSSNDDLVQLAKSKTERMAKSADLAIKATSVHHDRLRDIDDIKHKMAQLNQKNTESREAM